jgi:hypothetical protein
MLKILLMIAPILATALAGCVSPEQRPTPKLACTDRQNLLHTITGPKLRDSISRLNSQMLEAHQTGPTLDSQERQAASRALEVAEGAESTVTCLQAAAPRFNLDADQLRRFHSLTNDLRDEATALRNQAQNHQLAETPSTLGKMNTTCTSCHELLHLAPDPAP